MKRYYDERGMRVPMSRGDSKRPKASDVLLFMFFSALICTCAYFVTVAVKSTLEVEEMKAQEEERERIQRTVKTVSAEALCGISTSNGESIRLYVMTDPEEGYEYIVSDRGGVCVRLRRDD